MCAARITSGALFVLGQPRRLQGVQPARTLHQKLLRVSRLENEAVLDRMAARLAARPDILDRRRESVEHPFGTIKQWMYQGAFLMRRLENVHGEFSLTALAYDIKSAITIVGVAGLITAEGLTGRPTHF